MLSGTRRDRRQRFWWQLGRYTPALFGAIRGLERVLVIARQTSKLAFAFLPPARSSRTSWLSSLRFYGAAFGVLQSRVHERGPRIFGPSMKDDLRYTPSDCFETFPFPVDWDRTQLSKRGREYYEFRAALMVRNNEGLTKTYNRFHDPDETTLTS